MEYPQHMVLMCICFPCVLYSIHFLKNASLTVSESGAHELETPILEVGGGGSD